MRKSRLEWSKQLQLISLFIEGSNIRDAASTASVNKNTATTYFNRLRELIYCNGSESGFMEADINFSNETLKEAISRAHITQKLSPFGVVTQGEKIRIAIFSDYCMADSPLVFKDKCSPDYLFFYSANAGKSCTPLNQWKNSRAVRFYQCDYHTCPMKILHGKRTFCDFFVEQQKRYFGIPHNHFYLYLKEFEWKFNNPDPVWQSDQLAEWAKEALG